MRASVLIACALIGVAVYFGIGRKTDKDGHLSESIHQVNQVAREMGEVMKDDLAKKGTITTSTTDEGWKRAQNLVGDISGRLGNEDENVRFIQALLAEMQAKAAPYHALLKRWETERPLEMATVKNRTDLSARRQFGEEMLRVNAGIVTYLESWESNLRTKAAKAGMSVEATKETVSYMMSSSGRSIPIQIRIRKSDEIMARSLIQMTDLMEKEWGKWKTQNGEIAIESEATAKRYEDIIAATKEADERRMVAQRELIELSQRLAQ